jgi:PBSX family phage terminase large subunit
MNLQPFSRKQLEVIATSNARINVLTGPVRSGKTLSSIVRWIEYLYSAPEGDLLMSGKTKHTIKRNVLNDMFDLIGNGNYHYNSSEGVVHAFGRKIHIVGANDEQAEGRIRGMTIAGWYDDESTLKPESFITQGLARMSVKGAKCFWTTNPDSPYHYLYTDYITNTEVLNDGIVKVFNFEMDDNLSLDEEYKTSLKKLYKGLWYKRNILGLWVLAEGAVYDMFEDAHIIGDSKMPHGFSRYFIGIDFGTSNATVFLLIGQSGDNLYVLDEYYWDSRQTGRQKTVVQYSKDLEAFMGRNGLQSNVRIFIDPSASPLIVQLRQDGVSGIVQADNDVGDGIAAVSSALSQNKLLIHEKCAMTIKEFYSYTWDPKAQKRGQDKPMKQFDHAMDALRYPVFSVFGRPHIDGPIPKPMGW